MAGRDFTWQRDEVNQRDHKPLPEAASTYRYVEYVDRPVSRYIEADPR